MAVRFILGRSGSGKTHHCLEAMRAELHRSAEGPALIFLAPEQATFQIERALIETPGLGGFHRGRVVSFRRLTGLLFNELGGPAWPAISPVAKQMALRAVLEPLRDRLTTFAASLDRAGFVARLAGIFREFHQYQVTAGQLRERAAGEPRERLRRKLTELADAFDAFNEYLKAAKFTDPDAALTLAADRLSRSALIRGSRVWVDGFAGFTPQELSFLGGLAQSAESVDLALVIDPADLPAVPGAWSAAAQGSGAPEHVRLFRRTEQTYLRLVNLFADKGIQVGEPLVLSAVRRFAAAPILAGIERGLFAPPPTGADPRRRTASCGDRGDPLAQGAIARDMLSNLVLVEAPDRRSEVRAAVNHVRRLVGACGYRYRDIAVILRDMDAYWQHLVEAFAEAGVPCFIDRRESVAHHSLVELLRAAVGSIARRANQAEIVAFLKTGLPTAGIDAPAADVTDAVDRLENYALAVGLSGAIWFQPDRWDFAQARLSAGLLNKEEPGDEQVDGAEGQRATHSEVTPSPRPSPSKGEGEQGALPEEKREQRSELVRRVAREGLAALAELHELAGSLSQPPVEPKAEEWAAGLWRMLQRLQVRHTLTDWVEQGVGANGQPSVHLQVLDAVEQLLGDLALALGPMEMSAGTFVQVLEAGLSQLTLGLVPPALDQVLIGHIERSRHPAIKAAMVLGLAERTFPRLAPVQAILTNEDREALTGVGGQGAGEHAISDFGVQISNCEETPVSRSIQNPKSKIQNPPAPDPRPPPSLPIELAPSRNDLLFDEDLLAYLALTRPSEQLWVSYPAADDDGRPINPSRYVVRLRQLMPELPVRRLAEEHAALGAINAGELAGNLADCMANQSGALPALEAGLYELARSADPAGLARAMAALVYANEPTLAATLARKLFAAKGVLAGSITRLECFAACPFQHLARFALGLCPRQRIALDAPKLGQLYHELLERLFVRMGPPPVNWAAWSAEELRKVVGELVGRAVATLDVPGLSGGAARYMIRRAEGVLGDLVEALRQAAQAAPRVRQVAAETIFGYGPDLSGGRRGAALPPLLLELSGGARLALRGRIDRIDLADDGWLFVIDYKTGANQVDWSKLAHGLSLQLLGYLLTLDQHGKRLLRLLGGEPSGEATGAGGQAAKAEPWKAPAALRPAGAFFQPIAVRPRSEPPPSSDAAPDERELCRDYQRRGLFVGQAARALDGELAAGQSSPFVKIKLNKDGRPSATGSDGVDVSELVGLMDLTAGHMTRWGESILAGRAAVEPYRLRNDSPCTYCDFRPVCRLDFDYNRPRYLDPVGRTQLLDGLRAGH